MKSLLLFKKFRFVLVGKKIGFDFSKYQIYFVVRRKKKVVFGDKYLALCLFHKINFFFI